MISFKSKMRIRHFMVARHYGGHGIHSPFLYRFLTDLYSRPKSKGVASVVEERRQSGEFESTAVVSSLKELKETTAEVIIWQQPFRSANEYLAWKVWRNENKVLSIWLPDSVVVFRCEKLPNQHFTIRN